MRFYPKYSSEGQLFRNAGRGSDELDAAALK